MTNHPIPAISNPQITTTGLYSGDVIINIRELLTDIDLSPLFESWRPIVKTQFLFRSGKIAMSDPDQTNEVHLILDEMSEVDGNVDLHIPALTTDDTVLVAESPQIIENKVLNACTIDASLNTVTNVPKSAIPSSTVYTDQANLYGNFTQDFPSGWARIKSGATYVSLGSSVQTGAYSFIIPVLAANDSPAMLGLSNIFTSFQKIQYTATAALTLYRPDNTVGNGTGIAFNLRNSANTETQFAALYAVNNQNTAGSELGSLAFYTRNGASLVERMLLTYDNKLSIGVSGSRIIWDPSTINTSSKTFTLPNLSGEVQTLNAIQTPINKTLDVRTNTVLRMSRIGTYHCATESGVDAEGALRGLVGIGDQGATTVNTGGKYHIWSSKAVINDAAGVAKLDGSVAWRLTNPLLRVAFLFVANTSSNRRVFKGWTAKRLLSTDTNLEPLLSTESGFVFGHGNTDLNWQIWHNDATGTCVKTDTSLAIPTVNTNMILEISISGASFTWSLYAVDGSTQARSTLLGTGTISTRTPPLTTTALYLQDLVIPTTAAIQSNNIHYIEVLT